MLIPENKTIERKIEDQNLVILLYGLPMSGKTFFSNSFPSPLFLNTDGNFGDINREIIHLNTGIDELARYKTTMETLKYLIENKQELIQKGYKTIVLDHIDSIYAWNRANILRQNGIKDETEDKSHGAIYNKIRKPFVEVMSNFITYLKKDFNIVLVTQENKEMDKFTTFSTESFEPQIKKSLGRNYTNLTSHLNMIGRMTFKFELNEKGQKILKRILLISPNETSITSNRFQITEDILEPNYDKLTKLAYKK